MNKTFRTVTGKRVKTRKDPEHDRYLAAVFWGTIGMEILTFMVFVVASGVLA